jgi:leucyl/phenylalanyl-tRNA--protein transferase
MARKPNELDTLFLPADVMYRPLPADVRLGPSRYFPPPTASTYDGLVCIGGRLSPTWLLDAYSHGIFPWPMWEDEPIAWWSPNPRAVIEFDQFHISRRLQRTLKSGTFSVTYDRDFEAVIHGCATAAGREDGTWLTPSMIAAYCEMHRLGHAHSVEVWSSLPLPLGEGNSLSSPIKVRPNEKQMFLAGGTYGIAIGGLFAAESMFYRVRDASKVALAHLVAHLRGRGYVLLDIQQLTPHTASMGAKDIPRVEYLRRLARALQLPITFVEPSAETP